jgi:hypothetical protein
MKSKIEIEIEKFHKETKKLDNKNIKEKNNFISELKNFKKDEIKQQLIEKTKPKKLTIWERLMKVLMGS